MPLTPKEISKKRLAQNKLMKVKPDERNPHDLKINEKETEVPHYPIMPKTTFKKHYKVLGDVDLRNPFDAPDKHRIFSKSKGLFKTKPLAEPLETIKTICDVDPTFFKIIEGRPLRHFDDIKIHMKNIRDITLFKANAAYLKDQIVHIKKSFAFENAEYNAIERLFFKCKDGFVQFAKDSYAEAKQIENLAALMAKGLDAMTEELDSLSFKFVEIRNKVGAIMVTFEILSIYGHFLNSLAPLRWREKNDQWFDKTSGFVKDFEYKPTANIFINYTETKLFFTNPRQMDQIFDNLGRQCLSYMQIDALNSSLLASMIKRKTYLKSQMMEETDILEYAIEAYRGHVKFMEENEKELETKFFRVLEKDFRVLYASYDVNKLFTCLQYTNIQLFHGYEDPKDSITSMMLHIEGEYIKLNSNLDNLDNAVVRKAKKEFFTEDLKMMKRAHLAHRHLKCCDILSKALYVSFEPPRLKNKKQTNHDKNEYNKIF